MPKPHKESIAFYALNEKGEFLLAKRAKDDPSFPNLWSLPSGSLHEGESSEEAVMRSARDKLGVQVEIVECDGDETIERTNYYTHMKEYLVKIVDGEPKPSKNKRATNPYQAVKWSSDPELLREAANNGSVCSRIFLRKRGLLQ